MRSTTPHLRDRLRHIGSRREPPVHFDYRENRAGLVPGVWINVLLPGAAILLGDRLPSGLREVVIATGGFWLLIGFVYVYAGWVMGLRIVAGVLVVGACRRGERRMRRGKAPDTVMMDPGWNFRHIFRFQLRDILEFEVATGERFRYRRRFGVVNQRTSNGKIGRVRTRTCLYTPFVRQLLYVKVDLQRQWNPFTSAVIARQFTPVPVEDWFGSSPHVIVPTRRPEKLRAALYAALRDRDIDPEPLDAGREFDAVPYRPDRSP